MKFYISGEWVDHNEKINVTNPFDGTVVDTVPKGNIQDVENAIKSSVNGAKVMESIPAYKRYEILLKAANVMQENLVDLAKTITLEEGKVITEAKAEVERAIQTMTSSAEEAKRLEEMTTEEKEQIKMTSMVDKAKSTCKDLGFEEGTEKFSDCSLKLYSQSVELAAKQNQQVVIQTQGNTSSSGSNVMTIYDPVRDNNALIKRGQGLINGTCTLGDLSNC